MSANSLYQTQQLIANGMGMSVHDFRLYQSLAKYTPRDIAGWLHKEGGIVGQEVAVKEVASVVYSHLHYSLRPKRNLLLIGSTGCGKSEIMRSVQRFFSANLSAKLGADMVRTVDGTQLNATGWKGGVKLADVLKDVPQPFGCFLFIDEFDKLVSERYAGGNGGSWSVSELLQEQLLTTLDHQTITLCGDDNKTFTVDTQKVSIICMGAFTGITEKKANTRSIGFAADSAVASSADVTTEDLIDYSMMPEICGRLYPVIMESVSEDMMYLIAKKELQTLNDTTELHITVPDAKLRLMAAEAFSSGQGGRGILKQLQAELDQRIYDDPCRDMYIL